MVISNHFINRVMVDASEESQVSEVMRNYVKKYLDEEVTIQKTVKLEQKTYLLQLSDYAEKNKIMQEKIKLRVLSGEKVYINYDLTLSKRQMQKVIREKPIQWKLEGKTVKMGFKKLTVDGETWRWEHKRGLRKETPGNSIEKKRVINAYGKKG